MSTQENEYQVCVLFDASVNTTVRAATPEAAAEEAEEQTDGAHYKLGHPVEEVMAAHILAESQKVTWCSASQEWVV